MAEERLQKILAKAGYGSRRSNEELISAGRVKVNGVVAVLGMKADAAKDDIFVDNQMIPKAEEPIYIALYKPRGVLSDQAADDPRKNVRDLVDVPGHLFAIGRLDLDSEGLMILTNDGELTNLLTHPRYGHEKEYRVLVATRPDDNQLAIWRRGVVLENGEKTAPCIVNIIRWHGKGAWLKVVLKEGKKRQIREIGKQIGLPIVKLIRIRISTLTLGSLKPKEWRYLTDEELASLKKSTVQKPVYKRAKHIPRKKTNNNKRK